MIYHRMLMELPSQLKCIVNVKPFTIGLLDLIKWSSLLVSCHLITTHTIEPDLLVELKIMWFEILTYKTSFKFLGRENFTSQVKEIQSFYFSHQVQWVFVCFLIL